MGDGGTVLGAPVGSPLPLGLKRSLESQAQRGLNTLLFLAQNQSA